MIRRITRTISVKVNPPKEDYLNLLRSCSELFNFYTKFAYENKTYNKNKIHQATYHQLVKENPTIKSALIQTVRNAAKNIRNNYTLSLLPIRSVEQAAVNLPYVATVDQLAASQPPCAVGS